MYIPKIKRASVASIRIAARMPFDKIADYYNTSASKACKIAKCAIKIVEIDKRVLSNLKIVIDRLRSSKPVKVTKRAKRQLSKKATKSKVNCLKVYRQLRDEVDLSSINITNVRAAL